jgi:ribosomal protein S12 methylthiotransferase accessory factor
MEFAERYSCFRFLAERKNYVVAALRDQPNNPFGLDALKANCPEPGCYSLMSEAAISRAPMRWYSGFALDGQPVLLPMNLVCFLLEGSNGMASGNTLEEALVHGICEVIERHCLAVINDGKIDSPIIEQSTIRAPFARSVLEKLALLGQPIFVRDFSLDIGVPVIGVVRKVNASHCVVTAGAATSPQEALIRAVTENSQVDDRRTWTRVSGNSHLVRARGRISFDTIPSIKHRNLRVELETIAGRLARHRMRIFFVIATDECLAIPTVYVYATNTRHYVRSNMVGRNMLTAVVRECVQAGRLRQALRYIRIGERGDKAHAATYAYYRGCAAFAQERYQTAVNSFRMALRQRGLIEGARPTCLLRLAVSCLATRDLARAERYFRKSIREYPTMRLEHLDVSYDDSGWTDGGILAEAGVLYRELSRNARRKLAEARDARRLRRAQAGRKSEPQDLLTNRNELPMIHLPGETDAGPAGEHPARDSRLAEGQSSA